MADAQEDIQIRLVAQDDATPVTGDPAHLADLLWTMHRTRGQPEATYPAGLFGR